MLIRPKFHLIRVSEGQEKENGTNAIYKKTRDENLSKFI